MMPSDAMNFRPYSRAHIDCERLSFRHLAERRAFGNAEHAFSGPAHPGSLSIVRRWGRALIPRIAPIRPQLVLSFIAAQALCLPKT
jgi:hypothetical protein